MAMRPKDHLPSPTLPPYPFPSPPPPPLRHSPQPWRIATAGRYAQSSVSPAFSIYTTISKPLVVRHLGDTPRRLLGHCGRRPSSRACQHRTAGPAHAPHNRAQNPAERADECEPGRAQATQKWKPDDGHFVPRLRRKDGRYAWNKLADLGHLFVKGVERGEGRVHPLQRGGGGAERDHAISVATGWVPVVGCLAVSLKGVHLILQLLRILKWRSCK